MSQAGRKRTRHDAQPEELDDARSAMSAEPGYGMARSRSRSAEPERLVLLEPVAMDGFAAAVFRQEHEESELSIKIAQVIAGGNEDVQASFITRNTEMLLGRDYSMQEAKLMQELKTCFLSFDD